MAFLGSSVAVVGVRSVLVMESAEHPEARLYLAARPSSEIEANLVKAADAAAAAFAAVDERVAPSVRLPYEASATDVVDSEWTNFPRSTFSVVERLVLESGDVPARELYRHERLNRVDVYVPPARRPSLVDLISGKQVHIRRLRAVVDESSMRELGLLVNAGMAKRVTLASCRDALDENGKALWDAGLADLHSRLVAEKRPADEVERRLANYGIVSTDAMFPDGVFATRWEGGAVHGAKLHDLPQTAGAALAYKVHVLAFMNSIVHWFRACGGMDEHQATRLMAETEAHLDRQYPTDERGSGGRRAGR